MTLTLGLRLLLLSLGVYRLAQLGVYDDGPWDVIEELRIRAGVYEYGPDGFPDTSRGRLLACPHCLGDWLTLLLVALVIWPTWPGDVALLVIGVSGAQTFLENVAPRG